jgi:hypothetical protein
VDGTERLAGLSLRAMGSGGSFSAGLRGSIVDRSAALSMRGNTEVFGTWHTLRQRKVALAGRLIHISKSQARHCEER